MKKLESTQPSSAQVGPELEALSPGARAWVYACNDERNRRRASDYARGALARAQRTATLEGIVLKAIENHRAPFLAKEPWERASWLQLRIAAHKDLYGIVVQPGDPELKGVPDIRIVRRVLKKQGLSDSERP